MATSFFLGPHKVEARESLVDRRHQPVPATVCVACRGSREPCGSKVSFFRKEPMHLQSRLARALWIEGLRIGGTNGGLLSRLARALWIEGFGVLGYILSVKVEARESLVDRR